MQSHSGLLRGNSSLAVEQHSKAAGGMNAPSQQEWELLKEKTTSWGKHMPWLYLFGVGDDSLVHSPCVKQTLGNSHLDSWWPFRASDDHDKVSVSLVSGWLSGKWGPEVILSFLWFFQGLDLGFCQWSLKMMPKLKWHWFSLVSQSLLEEINYPISGYPKVKSYHLLWIFSALFSYLPKIIYILHKSIFFQF